MSTGEFNIDDLEVGVKYRVCHTLGRVPKPGPPKKLDRTRPQEVVERKGDIIVKHPDDASYGDLIMIQSQYKTKRDWLNFDDLAEKNKEYKNKKVWLRARVHTSRAQGGNLCFILFRRGFHTVQGVVSSHDADGCPKEMVKWCQKQLPNESVVEAYGTIEVPDNQVKGTSIPNIEIKLHKVFMISASSPKLPFTILAASAPETGEENKEEVKEEKTKKKGKKEKETKEKDDDLGGVGQKVRLDNRWIDIRTPANHAIFRLQSAVGTYFRMFFLNNGFFEIHSPKITPGVSEGGSQVFRFSYFGNKACLAQSPQLYKQMAVLSDLFKVFEIGPVFRAENSQTHRHLCEFTGLDFEMEIKEHYHEILKVLGDLFVFIFEHIAKNHKAELAAVALQYPFQPLKYKKETLVIPFSEAISMLRKANIETGDYEDFSTPNEKLLGRLVREKYDTDFYIIDQYPITARPFYTMPSSTDKMYTNSYDVFVRGEEITSGAQRVHDVELLKKRAKECGIPESNIKYYLESFKYGAYPHGGAGIGLERVVMLYLGLDNIRKTSLFPRDPNRVEP